jgi:PKD repeat protein
MKQTLKLSWVLIALLALTVVTSCKKDDDDDVTEPTAGFTYQIDATNPMLVHFTNTSVNATSYKWDFGDGNTSNDKDPDHEYTSSGTFNVKLTASNGGSSDVITIPIMVSNPDALKDILTGGDQKTWRLTRSSSGVFPLEVGPQDHSTIWWSFGGNSPLVERLCLLNDDWTFKDDGTMEFRANGDYWGEEFVGDVRIFAADLANKCNSTDDMRGPNGEDLSVWGDGDHQFSVAGGKLTVTGLGAYIGLVKIGTGKEVTVPQESVTYDIVSLTEGTVDSLIIESKYTTGDGQPAYWRVVLVHYDNPADEPDLPTGTPPEANFQIAANAMTVTFTNTSIKEPDTYVWNFGDGSAESTEVNPTHTYTTPGIYEVTLTASNENGSNTAAAIVLASETELTEADLLGTWKIRVAEKSIFVGPNLGLSHWWSVPLNFLTEGGGNETEDWRCMTDDEFIFSTGGVYEYKTNGSARNDGYMGSPNGCWSDEQIAASGNGAAFGSNVHSYVLNANGAEQTLVLTNGATGAAFVGFYKGYYGGENTNNNDAPNGGNTTNQYQVMGYGTIDGVDYLYLSVDLNGAEDAGSAWSVILQREAAR